MKSELTELRRRVFENGYIVKTKKWQGMDNPPAMIEILHTSMEIQMTDDTNKLSDIIKVTQPWADEHFEERVGGLPLNPPPTHSKWLKDTDKFMDGGIFSHSYPERMWSKGLHSGIRYNISDLNDLVKLLTMQPDTRQAYLPIFFPEDLSAACLGQRVPCTLGWHFISRHGKLHCFYPIRSCDVVRHLHNDLYFANKLTLWIIDKAGLDLEPGMLHFACTSLHAFESDLYAWNKGRLS